jgi:hypothetical protein
LFDRVFNRVLGFPVYGAAVGGGNGVRVVEGKDLQRRQNARMALPAVDRVREMFGILVGSIGLFDGRVFTPRFCNRRFYGIFVGTKNEINETNGGNKRSNQGT